MSLYEIGRLCLKIAGRDAGRKCEPLNEMLKLKEGASHEEVKKAFEKLGLSVWTTNPKKVGERPHRKRKSQQKAAREAKPKRKEKSAAQAVEGKEQKKSPAKTEKKKKE